MTLEKFINDTNMGIIPEQFASISYSSPTLVHDIDQVIETMRQQAMGTEWFPSFEAVKATSRNLMLRKAREEIIAMQNKSYKDLMNRLNNLAIASPTLFPYNQILTDRERAVYAQHTSILEMVVNKFEENFRIGGFTDCLTIRSVIGNHKDAIYAALDSDYKYAEDTINFWLQYDRKIRPPKIIKLAQRLSQTITGLRSKVDKIIKFDNPL